MKIGLVPMSAKPFHAGHKALIDLAAKECDKVIVYVSTSDRKKKGEFAVSGETMSSIWKDDIEQSLPGNVEIVYGGMPVRHAYEELQKANEEGSQNTYAIYSDSGDIAGNFPDKSLSKYAGQLFDNDQIITRGISRKDKQTVDVSGTAMRQWLANGDKENFIKHLPANMVGEKIWKKLRNESLLRSYVSLIISSHH